MEQIFKYLTAEEERALLEKGGQRRFDAEDTIVSEGAEHNAIYVIRSGGVRVEKDSAGFALELTRLGPGQIFGEMSFLDGIAASATVVADVQGATVSVIGGDLIEAQFERNPGFFGRFYKSLADILSRRLRHTNVMVAVDEAWQPM
jgi:CRP-like cAMP-binding protein